MPYLWKVFRTLLPIISKFATNYYRTTFYFENYSILMTHCTFSFFVQMDFLHYVDTKGMQLQNKSKTERKEIVSLLM